ncbi:hypothetical protein WAK64_19030 [Bacillus spongiae]|uniref:Uncharacterized protein n=1 Tax=Bacillus spongiae TaxID=2683610 RepID=A0ABU8HJ50_9BACI
MASFVLLIKEYENNEVVVYRFGPNEDIIGKIELNKITGRLYEIKPIPDPNFSSEFYYKRAARRLAVIFSREGGVFPEKTAYQS